MSDEKVPRRRFLKYAGLGVVAVAAAGGGYYYTTQRAKPSPNFIAALPGEPATLNYGITTDPNTCLVSSNVYEQLLTQDENYKVIPELADSYTVSSDGKTYSFKLVRNAKWHDGKAFTSADVKFCIENVTAKYHPFGTSALAPVLDSVETPDDYTAVFKLKRSYGPFIPMMSSLIYIIPKHLYEGTDPLKNDYNMKPIGTGPFKFVEWVKGDHITLEKNNSYWKEGIPRIDKAIYRIIPDINTRSVALETGEIDYIVWWGFPVTEAVRLSKNPNLAVFMGGLGWAGMVFVGFNVRKDVTGKNLVRQAISHAIDKEYISKAVYQGISAPCWSIAPSHATYYTPAFKIYAYNPDKANSLLDQANYPKDASGKRFNINIVFNIGADDARKTAEIFKDYLGRVGITVDLMGLESASWLQRVFTDWNFDMAVIAPSCGPDPDINVKRFYDTRSIVKAPWKDAMGYGNAQLDAMWDEAASESDQQKRIAIYKTIQEYIAKDAPIIPIVDYTYCSAWKKEWKNSIVTGTKATLTGPYGYWGLRHVYYSP